MATLVAQADARHLPVADKSVDLVVTSPPYLGIRDYGTVHEIGTEATPQAFVKALIDVTRELIRVLKPRGSIFVNLGDSYAAYNANRGDGQLQTNAGQSRPTFARGLSGGGAVRNKSLMLVPERYRIACVDELSLIARAVIVWRKRPSMPAGRLRDRVRTVHEDWVHLTLTDRYYHDEAALREMGEGQMPPSVWDGPVARRVGAGDHPAMFPAEWPGRFITGWCPPGGVVLDPFGGLGTTALAARDLGRVGLSLDLSRDYSRAARVRLGRAAVIDIRRERAVQPARYGEPCS